MELSVIESIHIHINGILFLRVHVGIAVVALKRSEELLRPRCCFPLASYF